MASHLLIDCSNVAPSVCLDDAVMLAVIASAAERAGATVISQLRYRFGHNSPPGFTAIILLDESHVSVHTYSDAGQLVMDIFCCGKVDPNSILRFITFSSGVGRLEE